MCPVHIPPQLPEVSPMIISETETHIIVSVEIAKATLFRNMRFLENLRDVASRGEWEPRHDWLFNRHRRKSR
jgi:hypothetical protein